MSKTTLPIDDTLNLTTMRPSDVNEDDGEEEYNQVNSDRDELIQDDAATVVKPGDRPSDPTETIPIRHIISVFILFLVNLLNYMDRFTVAGVLPKIKSYYGGTEDLSNADAGLLQTSFIIFYMIFSPIFGFLGDRLNRTILMTIGIFAWSLVTLLGSFVPDNMFWLFVIMRGLVGIGEASYSTIAPTIIADLFKGDTRTKALTVFYFAIPVGSGLGYILGSEVAKLFGHWQFALRFSPILGVVCSALIFFVIKEPDRGSSEGAHLQSDMSCSSWMNDLKELIKNKSFMLCTGGFTSVAFVAGALSFWAPTFMNFASKVYGNKESLSSISFKFGIITVIAGIVGVLSGSTAARVLRPKYRDIDPLVCAFGLLMCAPFLFLTLYLSCYSATATWVFIFIGSTMLCLNWAIATDILLYVVRPTRRSTAEAVQILVGHTFGDAGSPYLVGVVSDAIKGDDDSDYKNYISLQYAMYMMTFVAVIGGAFYLATAIFIKGDRDKADQFIQEAQADNAEAATTDDNSIQDYRDTSVVT